MTVMTVRIDEKKRKALKVIASLEGKTMGAVISGFIDDYIKKNKTKINALSENSDLKEIMALSENAFMEWDNDENEIYNDL